MRTRREFVAAATAAALGAAAPPAWARLTSRRPGIGPGRFRDGVASGEPGATSVTFWSRLRTSRPRSGARLIVARDEDMRRVVATKVVPTGNGIDHTLKARIRGLEPATEYFYVWESGTDVSPVGRTRTRPPADSAVPLRIAFSSCQNFPLGYFTAHSHAATEDLDLYVFLGDYIYERDRQEPAFPDRVDPYNATGLRSYRRKYRVYRSDTGLQELHRLHPSVHIWDDHEVENNYSDNAPPPPLLQRTAGYRAAHEWLPRVVDRRDRYRIYKRIPFGATADLFLLDERQYRTGHNDGRPRRILGDAQMAWLLNGLRTSRATWKLIANQVAIAAHPFGNGVAADCWDGYSEDRALLLGEIERAGIQNVVFLTGDAHVFSCNALASDFEALGRGERPPSAIEYLGGAVTSTGLDKAEADVRSESPWVRQYNGRDRGYTLMALDSSQLVTEYRRSDVSHPAGGSQTFERFTQPAGINDVSRETVAPV